VIGAFFDSGDPNLKLGRLHELKCTRMTERRSSCRIALPIFQHGEPDYAEIDADFMRDDTGALHYDDHSDRIVVN
jgi:hypothetical protein